STNTNSFERSKAWAKSSNGESAFEPETSGGADSTNAQPIVRSSSDGNRPKARRYRRSIRSSMVPAPFERTASALACSRRKGAFRAARGVGAGPGVAGARDTALGGVMRSDPFLEGPGGQGTAWEGAPAVEREPADSSGARHRVAAQRSRKPSSDDDSEAV